MIALAPAAKFFSRLPLSSIDAASLLGLAMLDSVRNLRDHAAMVVSDATILGLPEAVFVPFAFGALIVLLILLVVLTRPPGAPEFPPTTMKILRVFVALSCGAIAGGLTGFIGVEGKLWGLAIQAGGGLAVFVIVFVGLKRWGT